MNLHPTRINGSRSRSWSCLLFCRLFSFSVTTSLVKGLLLVNVRIGPTNVRVQRHSFVLRSIFEWPQVLGINHKDNRGRVESIGILASSASPANQHQKQQQQQQQQQEHIPEWIVYVDQSKSSLEKGGSATLDAFIALAPPNVVTVLPAVISKPSSLKAAANKGPFIRCFGVTSSASLLSSSSSLPLPSSILSTLDVPNVDSVDKVYRILTKHMQVQDVNVRVCDCLKHKYRGNGYLEEGKVGLAIDAYNQALALNVTSQTGMILLMRATAHLKRAHAHREQLKSSVQDLMRVISAATTTTTTTSTPTTGTVPSTNGSGNTTSTVQATAAATTTTPTAFILNNAAATTNLNGELPTILQAASQPLWTSSMFPAVMESAASTSSTTTARLQQRSAFRHVQFRHGLYQHGLLQASQDALRATALLPHYGPCFVQAGDGLVALWKLKESVPYYERAVQLDPALARPVRVLLEQLRQKEELLDQARVALGSSRSGSSSGGGGTDAVMRLALDVS